MKRSMKQLERLPEDKLASIDEYQRRGRNRRNHLRADAASLTRWI